MHRRGLCALPNTTGSPLPNSFHLFLSKSLHLLNLTLSRACQVRCVAWTAPAGHLTLTHAVDPPLRRTASSSVFETLLAPTAPGAHLMLSRLAALRHLLLD